MQIEPHQTIIVTGKYDIDIFHKFANDYLDALKHFTFYEIVFCPKVSGVDAFKDYIKPQIIAN